ncbi:hypothetical protein [Streptomyces olivaceus]|uniref:hypothetical protein n=1 Tax=Streptomyces olivaceus TaxID=47716 RepID=UPI0022EE3465|nr:hypothetical protein [Streptomyces olivaceus]GHI91705.1 hypothetical protein TPA0905_11760 [Streptomyces olivaceus]
MTALVRAFAFQVACSIAILTTATAAVLAGLTGDRLMAAGMSVLTLAGIAVSAWGWRDIETAQTGPYGPPEGSEQQDPTEHPTGVESARQTPACPTCGPLACRCTLIADETSLGWTRLSATCCLTAWATHGDLHDPNTCARKATP